MLFLADILKLIHVNNCLQKINFAINFKKYPSVGVFTYTFCRLIHYSFFSLSLHQQTYIGEISPAGKTKNYSTNIVFIKNTILINYFQCCLKAKTVFLPTVIGPLNFVLMRITVFSGDPNILTICEKFWVLIVRTPPPTTW